MKLLKVLATGAVALAVSTSVMAAQPTNLRELNDALHCQTGMVLADSESVCIGNGLVIRPGVVRRGVYSVNSTDEIGDSAKTPLGIINSAAIRTQDGLATASAALTCRLGSVITGNSWLASSSELKHIASTATGVLIAKFLRRQAHPGPFDTVLTPVQRAVMIEKLTTFIDNAKTVGNLSSTESSATEAVLVKKEWEYVVNKNEEHNFVCLSRFDTTLLKESNLLGG